MKRDEWKKILESGQRLNEGQTADQDYKFRWGAVNTTMKKLHNALAAHKKAQAKDKDNWGFGGELGTVQKDLAEIVEFLTGK